MKNLCLVFLFLGILTILIPTASFIKYEEKSVPIQEDFDIKIFNHKKNIYETLKFEDYIAKVTAGEMPASFHKEALKAQSIAVRSYVYKKLKDNYFPPEHEKAVICTDSTHCMAFNDEKDLTVYNKAACDTKGIIMTYEDEPITAVFYSTSSGRTENSKDVWGGDVPYLKSVESMGDDLSPSYESEKIVSVDEFCKTLNIKKDNLKIGEIIKTEGGSVKTINISGKVYKGTEIRKLFLLKSANFTIEKTGDKIKFLVKGFGHGVGLSQYGANYMAKNGYTYEDILKKYYSGINLEKISK